MGKTINPSKRIYVNKIENRVKFKIKTGYYLQLLTPETMELVGSTKSKLKKKWKWWKCASFRNYWTSINTLKYCQ